MKITPYRNLFALLFLLSGHVMSALATQDVVFRVPFGSGDNNFVVVATGLTTSTDNSAITTAQSPYFVIQYANEGTTTIPANSFRNRLILDGAFVKDTPNSSQVPANGASSVLELGFLFGSSPPLAAGSHVATVHLDVFSQIDESGVAGGEGNNTSIRHFLVLGTSGVDLAPLHMGNPAVNPGPLWSDRLVISTARGTSTDAGTVRSTDTLYVDWFVMNYGTVTTTSGFGARLKLDGNAVPGSVRIYPAEIGRLQGAAVTDAVVASPLAPGQHTLTLEIDDLNQIAEADESNNIYSRTFTVSAVTPVIISSLTASGTQGTPFSYDISAANFPTSFNAGGLPAGLSVDTTTGRISGTPLQRGNFTVTLSAANAAGTGTAALALTIGASEVDLADAMDAPDLSWTTGGNGNWFGQTATTHDGADAAQSSRITDLQETYAETTVLGPGALTFSWKVSSEPDFDYLRFYLDGAQQPGAPEISGEVEWQQITVPVPSGSHTLRWTYSKDGSESVGSDGGWLDQFVFISSVVATTADSGPGSLRQVVADVLEGATMTFDPTLDGETIILGGTQILIDKDLAIDASSLSNGITVSGNNASRMFAVAATRVVNMNHLTLVGGNSMFGGAILNSGTLILDNTSVLDNSSEGRGGGIQNNDGATLTLNNSTVAGNTAADIGGGILNVGTLTLNNSTLEGNSSLGTGGQGLGGAIFNFEVPLTLIHCTLSGNTAAAFGGGLLAQGGTLTIENTIIAGNTAPPGQGPDIAQSMNPTFIIGGANVIGNNETVAAEFPAGPLVGTPGSPLDPRLGPLGDYGGPTRTMPPRAGSPALDATSSGLATDQRGVARPQGADFDIGAVEGLFLSISQTAGMITLSWPPVPFDLRLQSAPGVSGPWSTAASQDNPQTFTVTPVTPPLLFRLGH